MTTYNLAVNKNPNFNTVNSLTNLTFDRNNVRSGRMATENQIQQLWQDIIRLEERIDYCCRDIVFWDFRVRVRDKFGNIKSDYLENRTTGITRRGKPFIMTVPIKSIPKYESNTQTGSIPNNLFIDGDSTKCFRPDATGNLVTGLCQLLYRGTSGQYYELSNRKTGNYQIGYYGTSNFYRIEVKVDGSLDGSYRGFDSGTHFAYKDDDNNISISVNQPIDIISGAVKSYGRIYYLDLYDVTLEG